MSNKTAFALELNEPGDHSIDSDVICVLTRFGLRHPFYLLPTWLDYRQTLKQAANTPGLLRAAFLIENLTTCYSFSLWANWAAIPIFGGNVPLHVDAARRMFGRLAYTRTRGVELWSTKWRLSAVSNNLNWDTFDLRAFLVETRHQS